MGREVRKAEQERRGEVERTYLKQGKGHQAWGVGHAEGCQHRAQSARYRRPGAEQGNSVGCGHQVQSAGCGTQDTGMVQGAQGADAREGM